MHSCRPTSAMLHRPATTPIISSALTCSSLATQGLSKTPTAARVLGFQHWQPRQSPTLTASLDAGRTAACSASASSGSPLTSSLGPSDRLQAAQRYHDALFVDVHRDTALELAEADNVATRRLPADEWFYGEVTLESLDEAFDYVGARPGELFIDLGSGVGKAVLAAALARPFTACVGVELLPALSAVAEQKAAKLQVDRAAGQLPWLPNPDVQVALREGNFLVDLDLSRLPGTTTAVVYCFATCLQQQTVQTLAEKLATELPVGSRVMIISKQLPDNVLPRLAPLGRGWVDLRMAHNGEALTTFVYQRL